MDQRIGLDDVLIPVIIPDATATSLIGRVLGDVGLSELVSCIVNHVPLVEAADTPSISVAIMTNEHECGDEE